MIYFDLRRLQNVHFQNCRRANSNPFKIACNIFVRSLANKLQSGHTYNKF